MYINRFRAGNERSSPRLLNEINQHFTILTRTSLPSIEYAKYLALILTSLGGVSTQYADLRG